MKEAGEENPTEQIPERIYIHNKWVKLCNNHKHKHNIFYIKCWSGLSGPPRVEIMQRLLPIHTVRIRLKNTLQRNLTALCDVFEK